MHFCELRTRRREKYTAKDILQIFLIVRFLFVQPEDIVCMTRDVNDLVTDGVQNCAVAAKTVGEKLNTLIFNSLGPLGFQH